MAHAILTIIVVVEKDTEQKVLTQRISESGSPQKAYNGLGRPNIHLSNTNSVARTRLRICNCVQIAMHGGRLTAGTKGSRYINGSNPRLGIYRGQVKDVQCELDHEALVPRHHPPRRR